MKRKLGPVSAEIMGRFPSRSAQSCFSDWIANNVGLEAVLGTAGFLWPDFFEVDGLVLWNVHVAEKLSDGTLGGTPRTSNIVDQQRYLNLINLGEFFLMSADAAVGDDELVLEFGRVIRVFWSRALESTFPGRQFSFELAENLFDEDGFCLTFWEVRGQT